MGSDHESWYPWHRVHVETLAGQRGHSGAPRHSDAKERQTIVERMDQLDAVSANVMAETAGDLESVGCQVGTERQLEDRYAVGAQLVRVKASDNARHVWNETAPVESPRKRGQLALAPAVSQRMDYKQNWNLALYHGKPAMRVRAGGPSIVFGSLGCRATRVHPFEYVAFLW